MAHQWVCGESITTQYFLQSMAHRKMAATYEWKKAHRVAGILKQPPPHFRFFKRMFRHGLLGTTKGGHPVWFMKVTPYPPSSDPRRACTDS